MPLNNFDWNVSRGLGRGIENAGQGLAAGIERMGADLKKAKAYRAMAVDAMGMDPDQVDKMKLEDLEGVFMGQALKKARVQQEREDEFNTRIRAMMGAPRGTADPSAAGAMGIYGQLMPARAPTAGTGTSGGSAGPGSFSPEQFMSAAAESGVLTPEIALKFMQEGVNWGELQPHEFTTPSGLRGVYGRGGQFQIDPRQFMGEGPEIVTEDGRQFMRTPRGWTSVGKETGPVQLPATFQSKVDELEKELRDAEANAALTDEEIVIRFPAYKKPDQLAAFKQRQKVAKDKAVAAAQSLFKRYQSEGYGKPETWGELHKTFGLEPAVPAAKETKPDKAPVAKSAERITVEKDGKKFTVPKDQLADAKKQGYTEVK